MPPDFLLQCTACGSETVWDTEALPPVGTPEVGHPVLWPCDTCGKEIRHTILDLYVIFDKLHRDICLATELDRETVDRVMSEVYRHRQHVSQEAPTAGMDPALEVEEVGAAAGVPLEAVEQIAVAETNWLLRRGYIVDTAVDL